MSINCLNLHFSSDFKNWTTCTKSFWSTSNNNSLFSINELVVFEKPEKYPTNQSFVDKAFALKDYGALFDQIKVSEKYDITADEAYTLSKFKMCKYIKEAAWQ